MPQLCDLRAQQQNLRAINRPCLRQILFKLVDPLVALAQQLQRSRMLRLQRFQLFNRTVVSLCRTARQCHVPQEAACSRRVKQGA